MNRKTLIIGANGAIGSALVKVFSEEGEVVTLSREDTNYNEAQLVQIVNGYKSNNTLFQNIICCIGTLHDAIAQPEKSLRQVKTDILSHYFYVNSIIPAIIIKHFSPLLDKSVSNSFVCLSAMVGSTQDNKLGGWYGYRASKAALNSLVKTASIELKRSNKSLALVAIHPGTTVGNLSAPFAKNVNPKKYYTPEQTANRIKTVMLNLQPEQTGDFLNWDGSLLSW